MSERQLFFNFSNEIPISELPEHVGETLLYELKADEVFPENYAKREMFRLQSAREGMEGWMDVVGNVNGEQVRITYNLLSPHNRSHLYEVMS